MTASTLRLADGRALVVHDGGAHARDDGLPLLWHHGSPQTGALLAPLLAATAQRGLRFVSYGRPSYGGSDPRPGRTVADAAEDVAQLADALGLERFAVMGASGGGPHALACAALLPGRAAAAVSVAGLAPFTEDFDWFAGMTAPGGLRAAREGREARAELAAREEFDDDQFTADDWAALDGPWAALGEDAGRAAAAGPDGLIDDDVAFVTAWGCEPEAIAAPVLVVQGGEDRVVPPSHAQALVRACADVELWLRPRAGHISILDACPLALDWIATRAG